MKSWRPAVGRLTLLLVCVAAALTACDHFLWVEGTVVDCRSGLPLEGVAISGVVGSTPLEQTVVTDGKGRFVVHDAYEADTWVTLTLAKAGFKSMSTEIKGSTKAPLELCLEPATP